MSRHFRCLSDGKLVFSQKAARSSSCVTKKGFRCRSRAWKKGFAERLNRPRPRRRPAARRPTYSLADSGYGPQPAATISLTRSSNAAQAGSCCQISSRIYRHISSDQRSFLCRVPRSHATTPHSCVVLDLPRYLDQDYTNQRYGDDYSS